VALMDLRVRVPVETPERVRLHYEAAGLGSRFAAGLVDGCILGTLVLGLLVAFWFGAESIPFSLYIATALRGLVLLALFLLAWGYHLYFEAFRGGQTPGKRLLRIRVVAEGGFPVTLPRAAVRNLLRILDAQPLPLYGLAGVVMFLDPRGRRLGDLAAGTIVVRERGLREPPAVASARAADAAAVERGLALPAARAAVVRAFLRRRDELGPEARARLAARVAAGAAADLGRDPGPDAEAFLESLEPPVAAGAAVAGTGSGGAP
jgi:uncharacterized RDD family membrane protein YckC